MFEKLFGNNKKSKDVAKNRLELLLINERAAMPPAKLEKMRNEIIEVIKKYNDVDEEALEIKITSLKSESGRGRAQALVANIPLKNKR